MIKDRYHKKCNVVCTILCLWLGMLVRTPQGERYEGLIRHLFLPPRALSSHIVSATPTLSIGVDINYYQGNNAAVSQQCSDPWHVLFSFSWLSYNQLTFVNTQAQIMQVNRKLIIRVLNIVVYNHVMLKYFKLKIIRAIQILKW